MSKNAQAKKYLQTVADKYLAKNARKYNFIAVTGEKQINMLGFPTDIKPAEGKVVDGNNEWLLIKTGRSEFMVVDKTLLHDIPGIGSTIRITPYHRRRFDGKLIGTPEVRAENGYHTMTTLVGDCDSRIPIDQSRLKSTHLKTMINQISKAPAGDGVRNIGNMLVDAGGVFPELLGYTDPEDADNQVIRPSLTFAINTWKFSGELTIDFDGKINCYTCVLTDHQGGITRLNNPIMQESLGRVIGELVDDGAWKFAKVEILKEAPKPKMPAFFTKLGISNDKNHYSF